MDDNYHVALGCNPQADEKAAIEAVYALGHSLHAQGRYAEAAVAFRLLLQAAPGEERSWLALGDCHERADQNRIALELYSTGTVAAEPAPRCMAARARVLWHLGRVVDAEESFDAALALAESMDDADLAALLEASRREWS